MGKYVPHFGVKEAVFPFNMYHDVDPLLGPEMRSTGEVLGLANSFGLAYYKAQQAAQPRLPSEGTVLISVADRGQAGRDRSGPPIRRIGVRDQSHRRDPAAASPRPESLPIKILKMHEGRPNIADAITDGQIQLVINTPAGKREQTGRLVYPQDRRQAKDPLHHDSGCRAGRRQRDRRLPSGRGGVKSLQEYHRDIR